MKDAFPEFYRPSDEEIGKFLATATIIPDANVLLELYGLGQTERMQVFEVLEKVKDRLWLPYQAGFEYQRNRLRIVATQAGNYVSATRIHGARDLEEMEKKLSSLRIPEEVRSKIAAMLPEVDAKLRSARSEYEEVLGSLAREHVVTVVEARSGDPVRAKLDGLFAGRIGKKPDQKTQEERIKEGIRRQSAGIPPGYKDASKEGDDRKSGDYLIWAQLLDYAESSDLPVLFITNDQKEDWFEKFDSEVTGPRTELVAEFATRSQHGYHQVTLSTFLALANKFLSARVDNETINRVASPLTEDGDADALLFLEALRRMGKLDDSDLFDLQQQFNRLSSFAHVLPVEHRSLRPLTSLRMRRQHMDSLLREVRRREQDRLGLVDAQQRAEHLLHELQRRAAADAQNPSELREAQQRAADLEYLLQEAAQRAHMARHAATAAESAFEDAKRASDELDRVIGSLAEEKDFEANGE